MHVLTKLLTHNIETILWLLSRNFELNIKQLSRLIIKIDFPTNLRKKTLDPVIYNACIVRDIR